MKTNSQPVRIAPSHNGIPLAGSWIFFSQNDEFYASARDITKLGKISFHSSMSWQYRFGTQLHKLVPPIPYSEGWLHCFELVFLIGEDVLLPRVQVEKKVKYFETPPGNKLVIDLFISSRPPYKSINYPKDAPIEAIGSLKLSDKRKIKIYGRIIPFVDQDLILLNDMREKLRVTYKENPKPEETYVEANWYHSHPNEGNLLVIIPIGLDSIIAEK